MSLVVVSGKRSDGRLYIHEGYVYKQDTVKNGSRYLKCSDPLCHATAVIRHGEATVTTSRVHNHVPDKAQEELALYRDSIRKRAEEIPSCDGFRNICDHESARFPLGSLMRGFLADADIMRRSRKRCVPPVPKSLDDLHDILNFQPTWRNYALALNSDQEFFRETVHASDDSRVSVLVSPYFSNLLSVESVELAADATFNVRPLKPDTEQLMTLHAFETIGDEQHSFPCAYALMERKSQSAYVAALSAINSAAGGNMKPGCFMADFEKGLHNAAKDVFNNVPTSGCWFHYCNAIYQKARSTGLVNVCLVDEMADRGLKKCMALPLLPPHLILDGLNIVREEVDGAGLRGQFSPFLNYIEKTWLDERGVGTDILSVFELKSRTNNAVESAHYKLFRKLRVSRPNFWVFWEALKSFDFSYHQDRLRVQNSVCVKRKRKQVYVSQDENIKDMQMQLVAGNLFIDSFLERACHTVEGLQRRLNNHHISSNGD